MIRGPEKQLRARRSLLFVPANRPERFAKALNSGADMVCIECEDGVAPAQKDTARQNMLEFFADTGRPRTGPQLLVRINSPDEPEGQADLAAIMAAAVPPPALMVPKVRSAEDVRALDNMLDEQAPHIKLHLLIETAEALERCAAVAAASHRLEMLLFGGVDLAAELRCTTGWEPLLYARGRVVHAAALAGCDLMDMPYIDVGDLPGLADEAARAAVMGFGGKAAIHPAQIPAINAAFTPRDEEVAEAQKIITAYQQSSTGVTLVDGRLVEKPVIRRMQQILAVNDAVQAPEDH